MIVIKKNKGLFLEITALLLKISDNLPSIVQNDQRISDAEWMEFERDFHKAVLDIESWFHKVKRHTFPHGGNIV